MLNEQMKIVSNMLDQNPQMWGVRHHIERSDFVINNTMGIRPCGSSVTVELIRRDFQDTGNHNYKTARVWYRAMGPTEFSYFNQYYMRQIGSRHWEDNTEFIGIAPSFDYVKNYRNDGNGRMIVRFFVKPFGFVENQPTNTLYDIFTLLGFGEPKKEGGDIYSYGLGEMGTAYNRSYPKSEIAKRFGLDSGQINDPRNVFNYLLRENYITASLVHISFSCDYRDGDLASAVCDYLNGNTPQNPELAHRALAKLKR